MYQNFLTGVILMSTYPMFSGEQEELSECLSDLVLCAIYMPKVFYRIYLDTDQSMKST